MEVGGQGAYCPRSVPARWWGAGSAGRSQGPSTSACLRRGLALDTVLHPLLASLNPVKEPFT